MESSSSSSSSSLITPVAAVVRRRVRFRSSYTEGVRPGKRRRDRGEFRDGVHVDRERVGSIPRPQKTVPIPLLERRRVLRGTTRAVESETTTSSYSVAGWEASRALLLLLRLRLTRVRKRVVVTERREGREIGNGVGVGRGEVVLLAEKLGEVLVGTLEGTEKRGEEGERERSQFCLLDSNAVERKMTKREGLTLPRRYAQKHSSWLGEYSEEQFEFRDRLRMEEVEHASKVSSRSTLRPLPSLPCSLPSSNSNIERLDSPSSGIPPGGISLWRKQHLLIQNDFGQQTRLSLPFLFPFPPSLSLFSKTHLLP